MTTLALRVRNVLFRPSREWQVIKDEQMAAPDILSRHAAVLAAFGPAAAVLDRLLFGGRIAGSQPLSYVIAANILWYFVIMMNVIIAAVVFTALITSSEHRRMEPQGVQLAVYAFTPLFLVPVVMIVPRLNWLVYGAIAYSVYLLYLGIRALTSSGKDKALWLAGASFLAVAVIVGILNGLEYMLESYVMGKLFY